MTPGDSEYYNTLAEMNIQDNVKNTEPPEASIRRSILVNSRRWT